MSDTPNTPPADNGEGMTSNVEPKQPPARGSAEWQAGMAAKSGMVPAKFKNEDGSVNLEALVNSYTELERRMHTPPAKSESETPAEEKAPTESSVNGEETVDSLFEAIDASPGEDLWTKAQTELQSSGKLTEATAAALKKSHNVTDAVINSFVAGFQAQQTLTTAKLAQAVGGREALESTIKWAKANFKGDALNQFREALKGPTAELVLAGVRAKMGQSAAPKRTAIEGATGVSGNTSAQPFSTPAEMTAAIRDPRYARDVAYRQEVERRCRATHGVKA